MLTGCRIRRVSTISDKLCPRTLASRPPAPWDPSLSPAAVYRAPAAQRTREIRHRIISEYAGMYRSRLSPLITCAVGAYSQRIAAGAGSHGAVGRGGSVRGRSLPGSARSQPLGSERLASFLCARVSALSHHNHHSPGRVVAALCLGLLVRWW